MKIAFVLFVVLYPVIGCSQVNKKHLDPVAADSTLYALNYTDKGSYLTFTGKVKAMEVYDDIETRIPPKKTVWTGLA